ncbi:hypothetical protein NE647_07670 [Blautia coccoides]|uniref:hypothetical protein n=1 Tax=Blautia producta TaxID=33035 RepID=UPI0012DD47F8|nr:MULTISPECIES: hypothetical protein [Blautia]MCB5878148.1 hypothetical protein [Blautia producta]MCB6785146.1 hypothetical protein [Blautia producta]MCQ4640309.1 hypothetical protein [Blautia coccoides]MCQ5123487.1 hypothetical protein [Blautia producta]
MAERIVLNGLRAIGAATEINTLCLNNIVLEITWKISYSTSFLYLQLYQKK